jgi:hypothetical protein
MNRTADERAEPNPVQQRGLSDEGELQVKSSLRAQRIGKGVRLIDERVEDDIRTGRDLVLGAESGSKR